MSGGAAAAGKNTGIHGLFRAFPGFLGRRARAFPGFRRRKTPAFPGFLRGKAPAFPGFFRRAYAALQALRRGRRPEIGILISKQPQARRKPRSEHEAQKKPSENLVHNENKINGADLLFGCMGNRGQS